MPAACMGTSIHRNCLLVIFISLASTSLFVCSSEDGYFHCERVVRNWAGSSSERGIREDELALNDLLFFLHVPRTGGRTYFHCFLRKLYTSSQECPRSYDKLRFDPSKPNCRLMVAHDDYSLMSKLPMDKTSVVTILRDPIDRVFSTYEFSVEVAARFLVHPNLTSAIQMPRRIRPKSRGISTLDIWPWKYLVPWMRQDLFARREARKLGQLRKAKETRSPYDMEEMVMPLREFINDPIAHEIIHNGATFQVAGLTNNSYAEESHDVRNCVREHPELGHFVLEVAKHRLDHMLYVGLTEEHKKSASMFAELVGAQVLAQTEVLNSSSEQEKLNDSESNPSFLDSEADGSNQESINHQNDSEDSFSENDEAQRENVTVEKLMKSYEMCISSLRKSQASRRTMSLKRIAPAKFSKQARLSVPMTILQQIQELNSLDVELYKYAQVIFMRQQKHLMHNTEDNDILIQSERDLKAQEELLVASCGILFGCLPGGFLAAALLIFVVLGILLVTTRTYKLKIKGKIASE